MSEPGRRSFEATTHSAISVVNAIPAGKGVTIAIDIPCTVKASISPKEAHESIIVSSETHDPHGLVKTTVNYAMSHLKAEIPKSMQLNLQIDSKNPHSGRTEKLQRCFCCSYESRFWAVFEGVGFQINPEN